MRFFTIIKRKIIIIVDLIVQQHIMKTQPKKIKKPTREQLDKMGFKKLVQTLDDLDKQTKVGMDKISWWEDD